MTTKQAALLKPGDVVDLGTAYDPIRTVKSVTWHPTGIPDSAVIVTWVGVAHRNTIRADKDLTIISADD